MTTIPPFRHDLRGMTLVELILVVALVGVLIGLGISAGGKAMRLGQQAKSSANLRNISAALSGYVSDNGGRLPEGAFRPTYKGVTIHYWYNVLDVYLGGHDDLPANGRLGERPGWQNDPAKVYPAPLFDSDRFALNIGYGWNYGYFGYKPGADYVAYGWGSRFSEIDKPAETVIVGTNKDDASSAGDTLQNVLIYNTPGAATIAQRYNGKGLYLHCDGHVAAYTPQELTANDRYLMKKRKPPTN